YTPATGYVGADSFTFKAFDGKLYSNVATVSISVIDPANTLMGWWKLDDASGTTALDSSGNGNNGTLSGGTWTTGQVGGALNLNGVNQSVQAASTSSLNTPTTGITLAAWIYPTAAQSGGIIHKNYQYSIFRNSDGTITYADSITWSYATIGSFGTTPLN